jgi:hypothetical protein
MNFSTLKKRYVFVFVEIIAASEEGLRVGERSGDNAVEGGYIGDAVEGG